ncbi:hypothetical protein [Ferruginibacter sp.]
MKIILIIIALSLLLAGCNGIMKNDSVKSFIPGIYYSSWKTAFSESNDTLRIETMAENGSEGYRITRRMHVDFINAAKNRPPEYKIENWLGIYNSANKTVTINSNGRVLLFDMNKKQLIMGVITYKKL